MDYAAHLNRAPNSL